MAWSCLRPASREACEEPSLRPGWLGPSPQTPSLFPLPDGQALRVAFAILGKGCISLCLTCVCLQIRALPDLTAVGGAARQGWVRKGHPERVSGEGKEGWGIQGYPAEDRGCQHGAERTAQRPSPQRLPSARASEQPFPGISRRQA